MPFPPPKAGWVDPLYSQAKKKHATPTDQELVRTNRILQEKLESASKAYARMSMDYWDEHRKRFAAKAELERVKIELSQAQSGSGALAATACTIGLAVGAAIVGAICFL